MKRIKLTKGYYTKVDNEDFELLNQYKWCVLKTNNLRYAQRMITKSNSKQTSLKMHRVILNLTNPKIHTDHRDHDGLNNQRSNLRICTHAENNRNRNSAMKASSKYLGVTIIRTRKISYQAQIGSAKKCIYLGNFKSEIRAAIEYDKAAMVLHREFANLNILKIRK